METTKILDNIKEWLMSSEIDPEIYNQYLKKSNFSILDTNKIVYIVSSSFAKSVLKEVEQNINNKINKELGENIEFYFLTSEEEINERNKKDIKIKNSNAPTFDNFITGPSNIGALKAVKETISENYGKWNPLFIFGNSGLGKTHLLRAVEHQIKKQTNKNVTYETSQDFRNSLVKAFTGSNTFEKIESIRQKYIESDFFLLDDIQFLASNAKTNEVLFSIFNDLVIKNKQIILTSDKFPEKLNGFDKRLISRFLSGLSVELKSLDQETSLNILKYKMKISGFEMTEDAQRYVSTYYSSNVRKLTGIINQIEFNLIQNIMTTPIDLKQLEKLLNNYEVLSDDKLSVSSIKNVISKEYNITTNTLEGKIRTQPCAFARQMAMKLCHELLKLNYTQIGNEFGGRDHSTILSGIKKVDERIKKDKNVEKIYKKMKKTLTK